MTFSVVLRDAATGTVGALVSSARPAVGARTVLGSSDLVIVTQAKVSTDLAVDLQRRWHSGSSLEGAATDALAADGEPRLRQLIAIALDGAPYAMTGSLVPAAAATALGADHACAGNLLSSTDVVSAMDEVCRNRRGEVVQTLLAAGSAAESAGGDIRGRQSAALVVWRQGPWPVVDLRVDDHPEPLVEIARLWQLWRDTWSVYEETGEFPPARPAWVRPD